MLLITSLLKMSIMIFFNIIMIYHFKYQFHNQQLATRINNLLFSTFHNCQNLFRTIWEIVSPIDNEAVAAGEGALSTLITYLSS